MTTLIGLCDSHSIAIHSIYVKVLWFSNEKFQKCLSFDILVIKRVLQNKVNEKHNFLTDPNKIKSSVSSVLFFLLVILIKK